MKISKKDALSWFEFFSELPEDEEISPRQMEIALSVFCQIEKAVSARHAELMRQIPHLKTLQDRTYYVGDDGRFPAGCRSCLLGTGLSAVRKTNRCDARCPFCYDYGALDAQPPVGEGMWEIGGTKFYEEDLPLLLSIHKKPTGISYVYLEPFMEIEKYYGAVRIFHDAGIHQHLYTNGLHCTEENLKALADVGLDEIRFNLGASHCADRVIEAMGTARKYFPQVGIETPMTPEFYRQFLEKKQRILDTGLDFMNCAELHLNENNIGNYAGENLYFCRQGYISPIWSRELTLRLMALADRESWPIAVHDCSNRTKFARDLHLKAVEGGWFGQSSYGCEFDRLPFWAFLPVLRDGSFRFLEEEPLPPGFRFGDIVL
ncbi:MAG: radical SAM protein [Clostridia bacterium]|nr:radical SAM protein [Clostridia bacterium]